MSIRNSNFGWFFGGVLSLFFCFVISSCVSSSVWAYPIGYDTHSQGATITKKYFIFTALDGSNYTRIYRCNRNGTSISNCKVITGGYFGHANVIDHEWGSNYFRVEGGGCYDLSGKKVSTSKCIGVPANWSNDSGGLTGQGRTQYGEYRLKAFGGTYGYNSRIVVRQKQKSGSYKTIKIIKMGDKPFVTARADGSHYSPEIEDVMIDGDTGAIYYTMRGCYNDSCLWGYDDQEVRLYKYSGYKLPTAENNTPIKTAKAKAKAEAKAKKAAAKAKKEAAKSSSSGSSSKSSSGSSGSSSKSSSGSSGGSSSGGDNCVETSILGSGGEYCDDGKGSGIVHILNLIVDIMTIGVGILGVVGISVVGIQYLTSGDSEEKTRKAKRRLFEIIIGLVAYALIYALLKWLLPNFG